VIEEWQEQDKNEEEEKKVMVFFVKLTGNNFLNESKRVYCARRHASLAFCRVIQIH